MKLIVVVALFISSQLLHVLNAQEEIPQLESAPLPLFEIRKLNLKLEVPKPKIDLKKINKKARVYVYDLANETKGKRLFLNTRILIADE